MKITILNSSETHPINTWLERWMTKYRHDHDVQIVRKKSELSEGDLLFLISCTEIIGSKEREKFKKTLVSSY